MQSDLSRRQVVLTGLTAHATSCSPGSLEEGAAVRAAPFETVTSQTLGLSLPRGAVQRIAVGFCSFQWEEQLILDRGISQKPDLFLYLADAVYGDWDASSGPEITLTVHGMQGATSVHHRLLLKDLARNQEPRAWAPGHLVAGNGDLAAGATSG